MGRLLPFVTISNLPEAVTHMPCQMARRRCITPLRDKLEKALSDYK